MLNGQTIDTNSAWLSEQLNSIGIQVALKYAAPDDHEAIINAMKIACVEADIILMTGGLGPTKDDITKKAIADFTDDHLVFSQATFDRISDLFNTRNIPLTAAHRQQCFMPSKALLIDNARGTAPGMWIEKDGKIIISMPGVPSEMKAIVTNGVLIKIRDKVPGQYIEHYIIHTAGTGETALAEMIEDIVDGFPPQLSMAYLPGIASVKLRVTGRGNNEAEINRMVQEQGKKIEERVKKYVFGKGMTNLPTALRDLCIEKKVKVATAESCTGGGVSHMITSVPGSSEYFMGSVVSYSNELKMNLLKVKPQTLEQHGAVSEETVKEMVKGAIALMHVDCVVAISGIAGPGGGTPDKPVGTVWIAVGDSHQIKTRRLQLVKDRKMNIEYSVMLALNELRLFVQDNF